MIIISSDIGGTKTLITKYEVTDCNQINSSFSTNLLEKIQFPTQKMGAHDFYTHLFSHIKEIQKTDNIAKICIAQPGMFLEDGTIAANSAVHIFKKPDQSSKINALQVINRVRSELKMNLDVPIYICNDAIAQFRNNLHHIPKELLNRHKNESVVYINPGTGLGGGVAFINNELHFDMITDGHISQLQLPHLAKETLALPLQQGSNSPVIDYSLNPYAPAESLISGNALTQMAEAIDAYFKEKNEPLLFQSQLTDAQAPTPANISKLISSSQNKESKNKIKATYHHLLRLVGTYFAELCITLHQRELTKHESHVPWSTKHTKLIKDCQFFIDAGDFLKTESGALIIESRNEYLQQHGFKQFDFYTPESEGALGATLGAIMLGIENT